MANVEITLNFEAADIRRLFSHPANCHEVCFVNKSLEETITHYAMIPPKFAKYPLIEDILWSGVQEAMTGRQTPKTALLLMEKKVREVLT